MSKQKKGLMAMEAIKKSKDAAEYNIVACLYKEPELYYTSELDLDDFNSNVCRVFYSILKGILEEKKKVIDKMTVEFYLEKHPKLKEKYHEYGGIDAIQNAYKYIKTGNMFGYITELRKCNAIINLIKAGFPVSMEDLKSFIDFSAEDIYSKYDAILNHIFINADGETKTYKLTEGLEKVIEEAYMGAGAGIPYEHLDNLNKETGGQHLGDITLWGSLSNVGKSTLMRCAVLPSALKNETPLVVMLNEEDCTKWQIEMLIWISNNKFEGNVQKYMIRDGGFSKEVKDLLYKSAEWLKKQIISDKIIFVPFKQFTTKKALKIIMKYASMGVSNFILDTFKADAGQNEMAWLNGQQNMVEIYDVVKKAHKNVHINITFQLGKQSATQRYYTQNNVGMFKNIVDPASNVIMVRNFFEDEYEGGKKELKVFKYVRGGGKVQVPIKKCNDANYQVMFIVKNRHGSANKYQIVVKNDLSRNKLQEIGITDVPIDM